VETLLDDQVKNTGPLKGVRVFDMTRILAGPSATQILGDLGAEVLKIEKPNAGDDTRKWGPPYLKDEDGQDTTESAYYLSANRNKKSLTLDFTTTEGLEIARKLIGQSDILFENYKPGTLDKYGLAYAQLKKEFPRLIYCSLTGFGHTGPYKDFAGYDFLIQGMGGIMSLTGAIDGEPHKVGVAVVDLMAGMYSLTGILAALYHREKTGEGQFIDVSLLDTQVAWLSNAGQYYLTSGKATPRMGNAHPTIVPYEVFRASDGYIILAVGNDKQYRDFCVFAEHLSLCEDPRFLQNSDRVKNRDILLPVLRDVIAQKPRQYWIDGLARRGVPCGPVNNLPEVFAHPQVAARNMTVKMDHPLSPDPITLIGNPLKLSATPVTNRRPPPPLGLDTDEVLASALSLTEKEIVDLRAKGVI
jgi:crotonobetainyl-CoA:carnitine CoA-transferase CaiB-like acyl-CoA transferase